MRISAAGAATTLCQPAQDAGINFLVGFDLFTGVREAILSLPEDAWRPAIRRCVGPSRELAAWWVEGGYRSALGPARG